MFKHMEFEALKVPQGKGCSTMRASVVNRMSFETMLPEWMFGCKLSYDIQKHKLLFNFIEKIRFTKIGRLWAFINKCKQIICNYITYTVDFTKKNES